MLSLDRRGDVLLARFGEPEKLNALDEGVLTSLCDLARKWVSDECRVLMLGGNGSAFSAGGDLNAVLTMRSDEMLRKRRMWLFRQAFDAIAELPCITIAAVDGPAFGGGLELVLACDLAVASDRSTLGDGHINVGLIPGAGGTQRLPRLIGTRRALDLALSGRGIDAKTALDWGILNNVFAAGSFWDEAWKFAAPYAQRPSGAVRRLKRLIGRHDNADLASDLSSEFEAAEDQMLSDEASTGVHAFLARRLPARPK